MKKICSLFLLLILSGAVFAQDQADTTWKRNYRETPARINNLVHTKLDVRFDYDRAYMLGKAWITLKPHFYPTDSLALDAKGMEIKSISIIKGTRNTPLKYDYDGMTLNIRLDKVYTRNQQYTVNIDYIAKPNEYTGKGSAAITDAKGLYFINPKGEDKDKPVQIWTQGETEASSVWFPTIDRPNQKTTQELAMTVPAKFVSLSNGKLISQKKNADGTRTDTWKMDQPHAPYLFFMGVGDYAVVKDSYKGKEVSYYVEKEYEPVARKIFGNTPEMLEYFSKILNYEYPWNKYAQMVARDYVSGAMENTTAVLHQESAQQDARELIDGNPWERVIAHEAFHHWFGDLVTTESWSNLPLNESFANYSEYLWEDYKYGKDAADAHAFSDMQGYLFSQSEDKDLVRYYYPEKESMFDAVSYNKGGRILHMLRNHVGDSAFFQSLNLFLRDNAYKAAEAHQLRLAFEEITGRDLNWFWNQWFFNSGHPKLDIRYQFDDANKTVKVIVHQTQKGYVFRLPVAIDIYEGGKKTRYPVWVESATDTFSFTYSTRPDLVNFDAEKILLAEKKEDKTLAHYAYQYTPAGTYLDRREALDFAGKNSSDPAAVELLKKGLADKYHGIRSHAISKITPSNAGLKSALEADIVKIAGSDSKSTVKAAALTLLSSYDKAEYQELFVKALSDSSYSIAGAALSALAKRDQQLAEAEAAKLSKGKVKGALSEAIMLINIRSGREETFPAVVEAFNKMPLSQAKFNLLMPLAEMIGKTENTSIVKQGVDMITGFRDEIPESYGLSPVINNFLGNVAAQKEKALASAANKAAVQEQIEYIKKQIGGDKQAF